MIETVGRREMIRIIEEWNRFRVVRYVDVDIFGFNIFETVGDEYTECKVWIYIWLSLSVGLF